MVQTGSRYVIAYLLWAVSVALAIVTLLAWRSSAMIVLGVTPWDRYVEHALNQFGFLFLAIFGLAVIVFIEHFYRRGVEQNRLFLRFFLVSFWEMLWLALVQLTALIGLVELALFTPARLLVVVGELVLCGVLYWCYRRAVNRYMPPLL